MINELIYYLCLFLIIFGSRFVKVRKEINQREQSWLDYFLFAEEILYTAAGVVILLLDRLSHSKEGVFGIYFALVIFTAGINSLVGEKNNKLKGEFNAFVVITAIIMTVVTFIWILPDAKQKAENEKSTIVAKDTIYSYKIIIPYNDNTLINHIGKQKFFKRQLMYLTTVECKNDSIARILGIKKFEEDSDYSTPIFITSKDKTISEVTFNKEDIILKRDYLLVK